MEEYSQKEREVWLQIRTRAFWLLEHSEEIIPKWALFGMGFPHWRFWHYAVKSPMRSWAIFCSPAHHDKPARAAVREVTWLSAADLEKVHHPAESLSHGWDMTPMLEVRDVEVNIEKLEQILQGCHKLMVPLIPRENNAEIGGEELYGLECTWPLHRLQWSGHGFAAWKDVIHWNTNVRAFLQECLTGVEPR